MKTGTFSAFPAKFVDMSLQRLRDVLKREGITAYIIPTEDAHGVRPPGTFHGVSNLM